MPHWWHVTVNSGPVIDEFLKSPGKVTYKALSQELMKNLRFPFLTGEQASNILAIEITEQ